MAVKITTQTKSVQIGEKEYPKNAVIIVTDKDTNVGLTQLNGDAITDVQNFAEYKDSTNVPYTTFALLITALRAALYL